MFGIGPMLPLASDVSNGEITLTGRPFDSTSAAPEAMLSMPSVAMKSLILPFETTMPLTMPNTMPAATAMSDAGGHAPFLGHGDADHDARNLHQRADRQIDARR